MDVILVFDKRAYVTYEVEGHCCGGTWWNSDNCQIHRRILCDTDLCAHRKPRVLEQYLGHPVGWRSLGEVPIEGLHMYVVDHLGESFEIVPAKDPQKFCATQCDADKKRICEECCLNPGAKGPLCTALGLAIGIPCAVFRRVK